MPQPIKISATINAPVEKVWALYTQPEHIVQWNNASDDWHTPSATNDLRPGGKFVFTMSAKDGSASFDFEGHYDQVEDLKHIAYKMADDRRVKVDFADEGDTTVVTTEFDPEQTHTPEQQQQGWQAILDNFRKYAENNSKAESQKQ